MENEVMNMTTEVTPNGAVDVVHVESNNGFAKGVAAGAGVVAAVAGACYGIAKLAKTKGKESIENRKRRKNLKKLNKIMEENPELFTGYTEVEEDEE